jgi:hypothetical protein
VKILTTFFILCFTAVFVSAEVISVPENCLQEKIEPCLLRVDMKHELTIPEWGFKMELGPNSIVKIEGRVDELQIELLEGQVWLKSDQKNNVAFKMNKIPFLTKQIFGERKKNDLKVFDVKSFILSEYDLNHQDEHENVILRADFLSKSDMVNFIAQFLTQKSQLSRFLKSIEKDWQKEFKVLNDNQTKVLERSVASVENAEKQKEREKQRAAAELKKVRDLFFYRTFYR